MFRRNQWIWKVIVAIASLALNRNFGFRPSAFQQPCKVKLWIYKHRLLKVSKSYKLYARRLEKLGIAKLEDFLFHIPFRYEDYSLVSKIGQLQAGEIVTVKGTVEEIHNQYTRRWKTLQRAVIKDDTGKIDILWFNQPFLTKAIHQGDLISVSGKVELDKNKLTMVSPDYE